MKSISLDACEFHKHNPEAQLWREDLKKQLGLFCSNFAVALHTTREKLLVSRYYKKVKNQAVEEAAVAEEMTRVEDRVDKEESQ